MEHKKKQIPFWAWAAAVILASFLCSRFCFQLMLIQGESMAPTYHNLEFTVLTKLSDTYVPGDVIVFRCDGLRAVLVKRVAAGPGSTVQIRDGSLIVDGEPSALYADAVITDPGIAGEALTLGEGEYFVLGDNLDESKDSRTPEVGIVRIDTIQGKLIHPKERRSA